jgi:hypothetical protein
MGSMLLRVYRVAFDPYGSFNIVHCAFVSKTRVMPYSWKNSRATQVGADSDSALCARKQH